MCGEGNPHRRFGLISFRIDKPFEHADVSATVLPDVIPNEDAGFAQLGEVVIVVQRDSVVVRFFGIFADARYTFCVQSELDSLFTLPLAEFTGARNALAAQLKRDKRLDDANRVKALGKPSVSAWTVNQLFWKHRDVFDRLVDAGQRFRDAQALVFAGKTADLRGPTEARRAVLSELSRLAASLLSETGHNPSPDIMRRIAASLEALSVNVLPEDQTPGHLTHDIDPPGFESLSSFPTMPVTWPTPVISKAVISESAVKTALQDAERQLAAAQSGVKTAEAELKKVETEARKAEQEKQDAKERFKRRPSSPTPPLRTPGVPWRIWSWKQKH